MSSTPPGHEEEQYLNLIKEIIRRGEYEHSRNGAALSLFGYSMRFSLADGTVPLITTKKLAWKTCFRELMWFIRGQTNNEILQEQGVHIWDENSTREFLDSRGLYDRKEGDLGPIYGWQWRHFNAPYGAAAGENGGGVDQLANLIRDLKDPKTRVSRRHIISAWNPCQIDDMALPPCHVMMQFHVSGCDATKLSCALYQRSGDVGLGVPFNIASYAFLTHMIAHHCGLEAHEFVYFLGNAHIYEAHLQPMMTQMLRKPHPFPRMRFKQEHANIENYNLEEIEWISSYECEPAVKMDMIA